MNVQIRKANLGADAMRSAPGAATPARCERWRVVGAEWNGVYDALKTHWDAVYRDTSDDVLDGGYGGHHE